MKKPPSSPWADRFSTRANIPANSIHSVAQEIEETLWPASNQTAFACRALFGAGSGEPPHFIQDQIDEYTQRSYADGVLLREYPFASGNYPVREKVAKFVNDTWHINAKVDNVIPTSGVADAFLKTVDLLINKNDVVVTETPSYGLHNMRVAHGGGLVKPLDMIKSIDVTKYPDLRVSPKQLDEHITSINHDLAVAHKGQQPPPRVKIFLNINPSNPLGRVIDDTPANRKYYQDIYKVLKKHDVVLFDDLIYWGTEHDQTKRALPFLQAVPQAKDHVIMAFGPTKNLGIASMRSGVMVASPEFAKKVGTITQTMTSGVNRLSQSILGAAFDVNNNDEREAYFKIQAKENRLRCAAGTIRLLGAAKAVNCGFVSPGLMPEIQQLFRLTAYARVLKDQIMKGKVPPKVEQYIDLINSGHPDIKPPPEVKVLHYVFDKLQDINIPPGVTRKMGYDMMNQELMGIKVPDAYMPEVNATVERWMEGTKELKLHNMPQAGFYLPIDASAYIGKYAPVDIPAIIHERTEGSRLGKKVAQGENPVPITSRTLKPTKIETSGQLNFFSSWFGNAIFITSEMTGMDPKNSLLRLSVSTTPHDFLYAIDGLERAVSLIKPTDDPSNWHKDMTPIKPKARS